MADTTNQTQQVYIFGIRHHGPGSARSLRQALEALQPDCILVEGPPDAADVLPLLGHNEMQPPVALLIYRPDEPRLAAFYPFAIFSPELQAIRYGLQQGAPVRFMDLPQAYQLAEPPQVPELALVPRASTQPSTPDSLETHGEGTPGAETPDNQSEQDQPAGDVPANPHEDPLQWLAEAAGYSDSERWWEHLVEQRANSSDLFAAILEAMTALREATPEDVEPWKARREALREAYMRQTIRAAQKEGFERIAVVCGAWHGPALAHMGPAKEDAALLKDLPKVKVQATWVPWTYGRLSYYSGYGAGIESPGWYQHLWTTHDADRVAIGWMAHVAQLLREEDLDASSAHLIETVRTAEALAALRGRPAVGLDELTEATRAVLCFGNDAPMRLIHDKLIVGETLGCVPAETPMLPLQIDLQKEQRRLKLPVEATQRTLDLDLRKDTDLERSYLLHRLNLLGIRWGQTERTWGKKGTFHELWKVQWQPEFAVDLIEAGVWGNTVEYAATARARDAAGKAENLPALTKLVDVALLANLSETIPDLMSRLEEMAALSTDTGHLMEALPSLANVLRYGNVRRTDLSMVSHVVDSIVARICIGLPGAVSSLNDEAAAEMYTRIMATHEAIGLLQNDEYVRVWQGVLMQLVEQHGLHGLIAGRAARILLDAGKFNRQEAARHMGLALSTASEPAQAGAWVEGFLRGSGLVLLHDRELLGVVDSWLTELRPEAFTSLLPLLRRTFSTFAAPERRQIGEQMRGGQVKAARDHAAGFDRVRAEQVLPLVGQLLGLSGAIEGEVRG
ncbi:MAG: DUF5682 family protein [Chloroflexota bacterium]|nr:DUF5682 family protein [Chloroflexota bacterium]MDQ5865483.1 DUF5682 family protein [Chloroflexota bacterium]